MAVTWGPSLPRVRVGRVIVVTAVLLVSFLMIMVCRYLIQLELRDSKVQGESELRREEKRIVQCPGEVLMKRRTSAEMHSAVFVLERS